MRDTLIPFGELPRASIWRGSMRALSPGIQYSTRLPRVERRTGCLRSSSELPTERLSRSFRADPWGFPAASTDPTTGNPEVGLLL